MNKDFSKYQKIIDNFRGEVGNSNFESRYAEVTKSVPKTDRFLLKMELKRLAGPCTRLIDLRGHVDGECRAFEHDGKVHYVDDVALKVFKDACQHYGGYTFGVYEATMNTENNFRVIYQKEKSSLQGNKAEKKVTDKKQYPAKLVSFGPYYNRCEERMNFAVSIQVSIAGSGVIESTSSDLSVNGIKLRLSMQKMLTVGDEISLRFTGLEEEFQFGKNSDFSYKVRNVKLLDNAQLVGAERIYPLEMRQDGFKQFLSGFIQGNKRRYKINLDNTISALQSRSLEQYILPRSEELPIFVERVNNKYLPKYVLTCPDNQDHYQYWQDEQRHSAIYCLASPERVERLVKVSKMGQGLVVYSFVHKNQNKSYFYSADNEQLATDPEFMRQFLAFAVSKRSFRVTQLSLLDFDINNINSTLTLSESITKKNQYLNAPIPQDIVEGLKRISYTVVASQVLNQDAIALYKGFSYEGINMSRLRQFGHKRLTKPLVIDEVGINYKNQRQELRFKYKTPVKIAVDGVSWGGTSHDFSTLGLKIELEKATVLVKGDVVNVSFPALQKITSAFELKDLRYEVIRVNKAKTVINLRVYVEKHRHIGRAFFKALIDKNRDKLTTDEYAMASPGLSKALRNSYSSGSSSVNVVIQSSGSRYKAELLACGQAKNHALLLMMSQLSDQNDSFNLYPLFGHNQMMPHISEHLKKMQPTDVSIIDLLYIAIAPSTTHVQAITIKFSSEFANEELRQHFIRDALKKGQFFCIQTSLSRVNEPDMEYLNAELSYVGSYAIHRGKQIEREIWSVVGLLRLLDVTQETLIRYQLNQG